MSKITVNHSDLTISELRQKISENLKSYSGCCVPKLSRETKNFQIWQ